MNTPTLVPIVGSVSDGDISKGTSGPVTIVTTVGFVITLSNDDIETAQLVQAAPDPSQSLYRLFVAPGALISVKLRATDWVNLDATNDRLRARLLDSGASKRIEDTA